MRGRGTSVVFLGALAIAQPNPIAAGELWNTEGPTIQLSTTASAEALLGVEMGFEAFRRSETEGVEARQEQLLLASDQLNYAAKAMDVVLASLQDQPATMPIPYTALDESASQTIEAWANLREIERPETVVDLYAEAVEATQELGDHYRQLSERSDRDVFRDFLGQTFRYLRAGAAASSAFSEAED